MKQESKSTLQNYEIRINKVISYINNNLSENLSLEKLSHIAHFSASHFHKIFKELAGETLNNYIQRVRLETAANKLLHNPSLSITEIAMSCGFSSSATFARAFKNNFGISATDFRQESLKKPNSDTFVNSFKLHYGTHVDAVAIDVQEKQPSKFKHPFLKNYSPSEYNGHHQIWAITQDNRGVLFFGNSEKGIIEFDGINWRNIGIPNGTVRSLDVDEEGRVYVGGIGEFGYLDTAGGTKFVSLTDLLSDEHKIFSDVWKTIVTKKGVYFQTEHNIYHWDFDKMTIIKSENSFFSIEKVHDKIFVFQKNAGIMKLEKGKLVSLPGVEEINDKNMSVYVILPFVNENMLILSEKSGAFLYDNKKLTPFKTEVDELLFSSRVYCGAILPGGLFAIGTKNCGVFIFDEDGRVKYIVNNSNGLRDNNTRALLVDRQNALWLGLNNGIARIEEANFFTRI